MKKTITLAACSLMATAGISNAATYLNTTFDELPDGNLINGTPVANTGSGPAGAWDGGTATVTGGVVNTTSNDGYLNFASGVGLTMDLNSNNIYTFSATVDVGPATGTMGLFGQLNTWTTNGNTGWWARIQGDNDIRWNFRRANGTETFAFWDTTALLGAAGEHTIDFVLNAQTDTAHLFIDGAEVGSSFDLAANNVNTTLGSANDRLVVGAYNTTAGNRFDGTANAYSITAVPEPSSLALLGLGGLGLFMRRRK